MQDVAIQRDDTLRETKPHGSARYPIAVYHDNIYKYDFHTVDWHWHHEFQFEFATEGPIRCLIESEKFTLEEGWGLLINSGAMHRFEADTDAVENSVIFAPELLASEDTLLYEQYLRPFMRKGPAYFILHPEIEWQNEILGCIREIYGICRTGRGSELRLMSQMYHMFDIIYQHIKMEGRDTDRLPDQHKAQLQLMMQFIHDHYREEMTLDQIAASAAVGKSSAIQIFNTCIDSSPFRYLNRYRLKKAAELLVQTQKSIACISEETGFTEAGYFCRKFKETYGMTPGTYRKQKVGSAREQR